MEARQVSTASASADEKLGGFSVPSSSSCLRASSEKQRPTTSPLACRPMIYSESQEKQVNPTTATQPQSSGKGARQERDTFSRFLELPKELRLLIVEEYLRTLKPRAIVMHYNRRWPESEDSEHTTDISNPPATLEEFLDIPPVNAPADWPWELRAMKQPVSAVLRVCHEFREAAQKIYKLSFGHQLGGKQVWFDFNKDRLLLDTPAACNLFNHGIVKGAKDKQERSKIENQLRYLALGNLGFDDVVDLLDISLNLAKLRVLYMEEAPSAWPFFQQVKQKIRIFGNKSSRMSPLIPSRRL